MYTKYILEYTYQCKFRVDARKQDTQCNRITQKIKINFNNKVCNN